MDKTEKVIAGSFVALTTIILTLLLIIQCSMAMERTMEYGVQFIPDSVSQTMLDKVAENGWDIVEARRATDGNGGVGYELILKRTKR